MNEGKRMSAAIDHSTLKWVKAELDETLKQARQALEAHVENPEDESQLRFCAVHLHQVCGTLQMVELYGAAMLAEELEQLVLALIDGRVNQKQEVYELLMAGILQLPDYLDRIAAGHRDVPLVLLPLMNDLRASRGEKLVSENALFAPDLSVEVPDDLPADSNAMAAQQLARTLRHPYQIALLGWYRDPDSRGNLRKMADILEDLRKASRQPASRALWWVASGMVEALASGALEVSMATRLLLGQLDRQIKRLIDEGETALAEALPEELMRNLLFYVARAARGNPAVDRIKEAYGLDGLLPEENELDEARSAMSGHTRALMESVAAALKEDLAQVKDVLDLVMRGGGQASEELGPVTETLRRIGDTLGMLGLGALRSQVMKQTETASALAEGREEATEERLMDIASAMLVVESSLDGMVSGELSAAELAEESETGRSVLPEAEFVQVKGAVAEEAIRDMARAKDAILAFIENSEDFSSLEEAAGLFRQIKGGLLLLNESRAAGLLEAVTGYVEDSMLKAHRVPEEAHLDHLADAISGIEYYLENLVDRKVESGGILDVVQASVDALGRGGEVIPFQRGQESTTGEQAPEFGLPAEGAEEFDLSQLEISDFADLGEHEKLEIEPYPGLEEAPAEEAGTESAEAQEEPAGMAEAPGEEAEEEEVAEPAAEAPVREAVAEAPFESPYPVLEGEDIDDEILEIFQEEAEEEVANIRELMPRWLENEEDQEALTEARRSFHTIKGSGRLVGAKLIGEFAWAFENMLNRVIDQTVARSPEMCALLEKTLDALPQLVEQLRGGPAPALDVIAMMEKADALAKGELPEIGDLRRGAAVPVSAVEEAGAPAEEAPGEAEESTAPAIDPVLYDIFSKESRTHIANIRDFLGACSEDPAACQIGDELIRAIHTLHGSAHMAGAQSIAAIAGEMEAYAKALKAEHLSLPADGRAAFMEALGLIEDILPLLADAEASLPDVEAMLHTLRALPRTAEEVVEEIQPAETPEEAVTVEALAEEATPVEVVEEIAEEETPSVEVTEVLGEASGESVAVEEIELEAAGEEEAGEEAVSVVPEAGPAEEEAAAIEIGVEEEDAVPAAEVVEFSAEELPEEAEVAQAAEETVAEGMEEEPDQELVEVFLEEADDILASSETTLQQWVNAPDDAELMAAMQRELHTLKGGARMANFKAIGDLAHHLESLLIAAVDGQLEPGQALFDLLQQSHDWLASMVEAVKSGQAPEPADELIARSDALRRGEAVATAAPEQAAPEAAREEAPAGEEMAVIPPPVQEAAPVEEVAPAVAARGAQEMVRVRADLLDDMVNYAGEISIYRSRLEQQVGSYRFNLNELGQTVERLRDQLRKLDIETEAQILYRYERDGIDVHEDFDPLEMDRYSTLQTLSRSMAESINDLVSLQGLLENITRESETLLVQQARVNTELQEGLMRTRMVPFSRLAPRLRRIVRQAAQELGKRAELVLEGAEGEIDRTVIDRITAPLEHMLRNAVAHGIEPPAEREAAGKRPTGRIIVGLRRDGSDVVITVADDGRGMNLEAIRAKAVERGLISADAQFSDEEVMQFVLETGFSTAEEVSQIAGRGVGMDVVNSEVKQLGGSLHIHSDSGQGTRFTIRLPFTLAINQALLVQVREDIYAIPLTGIEGVVRMSQEQLADFYANPERRFEYAGFEYEVRYLGAMLGQGEATLGPSMPKRLPVLLVRSGDHHMALQVDALLGSREAVVKSVGPQISTVRGISGATILGDGRVVLILDLGGLVRAGAAVMRIERPAAEAPQETRETPLVMVVDDSITVRKVTTRLLARNDMDAITAKDGVDALAKLQEHIPDVMLLDIEMPRMDGFELATHIRNEPRLRDIPIIMITSRTGEKHRQRAMEIGVDRYLGKPYQESELLETIQALIEERRVNA